MRGKPEQQIIFRKYLFKSRVSVEQTTSIRLSDELSEMNVNKV